MVNEINKPSAITTENEALRLRMENANRNIQSMQQEHDELLREMDTLRQRAAELSLRQTQEQDLNASNSTSNASEIVDSQNNVSATSNSECPKTENLAQSTLEDEISPSDTNSEDCTQCATTEKDQAEDSAENDEYIRQKIEEIAALKAQFKRVQHMVNTSNLIEEHLSHGITPPSQETSTLQTRNISDTVAPNVEAIAEIENEIDMLPINYEDLTRTTVNDDTHEKEELLRAMLNMFNDFTSDLRDQATTLRAERDRLRALRDEILSRRRQQP